MVKLALLISVVVCLLAPSCSMASGASAAALIRPANTVTEIVVTCLACGEQWIYLPASGFAAGIVSLFTRRRKTLDRCPKCHSRTVIFRQSDQAPPLS
jgi:DNA-directed RNA polymerase subunit M/transcription elongation factor TFIIS